MLLLFLVSTSILARYFGCKDTHYFEIGEIFFAEGAKWDGFEEPFHRMKAISRMLS